MIKPILITGESLDYEGPLVQVKADPHEALKALQEQAPEVLAPTPEQILARLKELRDEIEEDPWPCVDRVYLKGQMNVANRFIAEIEKMIGGE